MIEARRGGIAAMATAMAFLVVLTPVACAYAADLAAAPGAVPGGRAAVYSLSLEQAIGLVWGSNDNVRSAEAGVKQARSQQISALSRYLPQLSLSTGYTRTLESPYSALASSGSGLAGTGLGATHAYNGTLNGSWDLLMPGRGATNRAATAQRRAADIEVRAQRAQAVLDVVNAYYDAVLSDQLVAIAEASLAKSETLVRQYELADSLGDKSGYDLLRAEVSRDNQIPGVLLRRNNRAIALMQLKLLLNLDLATELNLTTGIEPPVAASYAPSDVIAPDAGVPSGVASAVVRGGLPLAYDQADTSVRARATVREQELAVSRAAYSLRSARLQRLPSLSLSGSYGKLAYPESFQPIGSLLTSSSVGMSVALPLFTGGQQRADELAAEASLEAARVSLSQSRKQAILDIQTSQLAWSKARASYAASVQTVVRASRAYSIAAVRQREGLATQTETDDARIAEAEALSNRAQAARDLVVASVRLALLSDLPLDSTSGSSQSNSESGSTSYDSVSGGTSP